MDKPFDIFDRGPANHDGRRLDYDGRDELRADDGVLLRDPEIGTEGRHDAVIVINRGARTGIESFNMTLMAFTVRVRDKVLHPVRVR